MSDRSMTLVDTSVWVTHLKNGSDTLSELLRNDQVLLHPFVIGELALGNLGNRAEIISLLLALPTTPIVEHAKILSFIELHHLNGKGLGYVDVHLLASAFLTDRLIWTEDKMLNAAARRLEIVATDNSQR